METLFVACCAALALAALCGWGHATSPRPAPQAGAAPSGPGRPAPSEVPAPAPDWARPTVWPSVGHDTPTAVNDFRWVTPTWGDEWRDGPTNTVCWPPKVGPDGTMSRVTAAAWDFDHRPTHQMATIS